MRSRLRRIVTPLQLTVAIALLGVALQYALGVASAQAGRWIQEHVWPVTITMIVVLVALTIAKHRVTRTERMRLSAVDRRQMVRSVARTVDAAATWMLDGIPRLPVTLTERPDLVSRPAVASIPLPRRSTTESVTTVYEEAGRSLLIVGGAGSGKTALLFELASHLCRAEATAADPSIPVYVNMASWTSEYATLDDWLTVAVARLYVIDKAVVSEWARTGRLLPLIDGLDEVPEKDRPRAVAAIASYLRDRPRQIVVACRAEEYDRLEVRLPLSGCVEIGPPDEAEVRRYLAELGSPAADAAAAVPTTDRTWWTLLRSPLMLFQIARISAVDPDAELVQRRGSMRQRRRRILDLYVTTVLARRNELGKAPFDPGDARRWLEWLAGRLQEQQTREFFVDRLGSAFIKSVTNVDAVLRAPFRVLWVIGGSASALCCWLLLTLPASPVPLLKFALYGGETLAFTTFNIYRNYRSQVGELRPVWRLTNPMVPWSTAIAVVSVMSALGVLIGGRGESALSYLNALATVVLVAMPLTLAVGEPVVTPDEQKVRPGVRLRLSRRNAAIGAAAVGAPVALLAGVLTGARTENLSDAIAFAVPYGVVAAGCCWLLLGGAPWVQYRSFARALMSRGHGPSAYLEFLAWCHDQRALTVIGSAYAFPHPEIQELLADAERSRPLRPKRDSTVTPAAVDPARS
ncbi:MAG: NACHT domain-containing protein [Micromonosporaceae bacterium]|nr:NACHT domain-containing protein [Micromonosporaceae bacterium]